MRRGLISDIIENPLYQDKQATSSLFFGKKSNLTKIEQLMYIWKHSKDLKVYDFSDDVTGNLEKVKSTSDSLTDELVIWQSSH